MRHQDFRIEAAKFYLCDIDESSIEDQLKILESVEDPTCTADYLEGVVVWDAVDHFMVDTLIEHIDILAETFENIYKTGEFDGYEKIKDLIEKQYETK